MSRILVPACLLAVSLAAAPAGAVCPSSVPIRGALSCSSTQSGSITSGAPSQISGSYTCGTPFAPLSQNGGEHVYSFSCQTSGTVNMDITGLSCDIDIYVLNSSCSPGGGCVAGSTAASTTADSVTFTCAAGQLYYVVLEAFGDQYGACLGASSYTLAFDVSQSTGCPEDCNDGLDNDFDGAIDCADSDCLSDPLCDCDTDNDGFDRISCGGGDCDDTRASVYPGAAEACNGRDDDCDGVIDLGVEDGDGDGYAPLGGDCDDGDPTVFPLAPELADAVDNDCDGVLDEGTVGFDDDGDGYSELAGDCDDTRIGAYPGAPEQANWMDDDCDGAVDEGTVHRDDDGDGYSENGGDCDDADPQVSPARFEVVGNGRDDDCDGVAQ